MPFDRVVVYSSFGGRFRAGLPGTVMVRSRRIGEADKVVVLLDQMTRDHFAVLEMSPADVLRVGWIPPA
jgi:hypothetical protein